MSLQGKSLAAIEHLKWAAKKPILIKLFNKHDQLYIVHFHKFPNISELLDQ